METLCQTPRNVLHEQYNAHHLRELQALVEIETEDLARRMRRLCCRYQPRLEKS